MSQALQRAAKVLRKPSPDGVSWPIEYDKEIDEAILTTFNTPAGEKTLAYLKQITGMAHGPHATDAELRHASGQRHLVNIIDERIKRGSLERKKPNANQG